MHLNTDPKRHYSRTSSSSVAIHRLTKSQFSKNAASLSKTELAWAKSSGFSGGKGQTCLVPGTDGKLAKVLFGLGKGTEFGDPIVHAKLARSLPAGKYHLADDGTGFGDPQTDQLAWAMGGYSFDRYRDRKHKTPTLSGKVDANAAHRRGCVLHPRCSASRLIPTTPMYATHEHFAHHSL